MLQSRVRGNAKEQKVALKESIKIQIDFEARKQMRVRAVAVPDNSRSLYHSAADATPV
jgi:hypothetical protein